MARILEHTSCTETGCEYLVMDNDEPVALVKAFWHNNEPGTRDFVREEHTVGEARYDTDAYTTLGRIQRTSDGTGYEVLPDGRFLWMRLYDFEGGVLALYEHAHNLSGKP